MGRGYPDRVNAFATLPVLLREAAENAMSRGEQSVGWVV